LGLSERGRQAGLEDFLLGATAGMLLSDALIIAVGGGLAVAATWALRRPMTLVAFDADYAAATGVDVRRIDLAVMGLVTAVVVLGLKIVGLVLIVALLIVPPVTARFWTERAERVVWIAGALGAASGYVGAAISASAPALPTGPIILLFSAGLFLLSLLFAPARGVAAEGLRGLAFRSHPPFPWGLLSHFASQLIAHHLTQPLAGGGVLYRRHRVGTDGAHASCAR
jgi:ABC-type Mn2+/Zn2+ transport systems, permease components